MKELWDSIVNTYENCRGTGKVFALFLVAVLIIYMINNSDSVKKRRMETGTDVKVSPGLFLLAPLAGIGYAFTLAYNISPDLADKGDDRRRRIAAALLTGLLTVLTFILAGGWVFSEDDHYLTENPMHIRQTYVDVCDFLLNSEEGKIRVMASPGISPYMKAYSDRFDVMYAYVGDEDRLDPDVRYVYDQMSLSTPDEGHLIETLRKTGYDHIVYDTQKTYFELPLEEYGYELMGDISGIRIYRDKTASGSPGGEADFRRFMPIFTILAGLALLAAGIINLKKIKRKGGTESGLAYIVALLVILQAVAALIFAYEKPAAISSYICGRASLTVMYSIMPLIAIPAYYCLYFLLACELFKDDRSRWFMLFCLCILNLWGYQSQTLLPVTMLYAWYSIPAMTVHGLLPFLLWLLLRRLRLSEQKSEEAYEDDYYRWEDEDMKNHKIINARTVAAALLVVVIMLIASVYVMNRKINNLYNTTVNLQQQVEELKQDK